MVAAVHCLLLVRELTTSRRLCAFIDHTWVTNDAFYECCPRRRRRFRADFARSPDRSSPHVQSIDPHYIAIIIGMTQAFVKWSLKKALKASRKAVVQKTQLVSHYLRIILHRANAFSRFTYLRHSQIKMTLSSVWSKSHRSS